MTHRTALATYQTRANEPARLAFVLDNKLFDVDAVRAAGVSLDPLVWGRGWPGLLASWPELAPAVKTAMRQVEDLLRAAKLSALDPAGNRLLAPFRPERIFCAASNYIEHANEMGSVLAAKSESGPYMFLKLRNTVAIPSASRPRRSSSTGKSNLPPSSASPAVASPSTTQSTTSRATRS